MTNAVGSIVLISLGSIFLIFSKQIARKTSNFYYKLLRINFSEKGYQIVFLLVGIIFVIIGLLYILQIIKFK